MNFLQNFIKNKDYYRAKFQETHSFVPLFHFSMKKKVKYLSGTIYNMSIEIRQSTIYYARLLGRWDKRIVDQESDVPSIFFYNFYRLRALKIKKS